MSIGLEHEENGMQDKLTETLAVNTGNMIASLNLQVAKQQVANDELQLKIKQLQDENDKLKIENVSLKKEVKGNVPRANSSNNKQISK